MDSELKELEDELGRLAPEALPEGLISRMEAAMDGWQETEREEKVVPFPVQDAGQDRPGLWRAAAAVALLGAAVALLIPVGQNMTPPIAAVSVAPASTRSFENVAPVSYEPLSAQRDVVRANNDGMVRMVGDTPHRCVRVEYLEHYEFEGEGGESLRISKPAVEFILIPVRAD